MATMAIAARCTTPRKGIITPEMKFVAIRERTSLRSSCATRSQRGVAPILPGEHQAPGDRADDHRPQFPRQDQREHRPTPPVSSTIGEESRQAALGRQVGARTR